MTGESPAEVAITLPSGQQPTFAIAHVTRTDDGAIAGVVKDAGDDPDVTHGALVVADVRWGAAGTGVTFFAGDGVGTVTKPGLPIPPGEPAINPVPRAMICKAIEEAVQTHNGGGDVKVTLSIPGGRALAEKTLNPRLGIVGGLSILGTTGIVVPYSCAAWIHSIHRGIDVARALGVDHIAGSTGSTSERAVQKLYDLPDEALIDMGDFVGGMLKYLKQHPVRRTTIAGGFAKMVKLAQGLLDLHSKRGSVDHAWLADFLVLNGAPAELVADARTANTAQLVLERAQALRVPLGDWIANEALATVQRVVADSKIEIEVCVFNRTGVLVGQAIGTNHSPLPR